MSESKREQIEPVFQRIEQNPYDFEAIAARTLYYLAKGDFKDAALDIAKFPSYGFELSFLSSARKIIRGEQKIVVRNGIYFITRAEAGAESIALIIEHACHASSEIKKILNCATPLLIIDLSFDKMLSMTVEQVPKICHIFVSHKDLHSLDLSSTIMHEIAHAFLNFNNRFLDEGWACYIQYYYTNCSQFPVEKKAIVPFLTRHHDKLLPLASLLSMRSSSDVYFQSFTENSEQRALVYLTGYAFMSYWVKQFGIGGVKRLLNHESRDISRQIEKVAGMSVMKLEYLMLSSLGITPPVYDKDKEEDLVKSSSMAFLENNTSFYFYYIGKCRLSMLAKRTVESQLVYIKLVSEFSSLQIKKNMSMNSLILTDALSVAEKLVEIPDIDISAFHWTGLIACASLKATVDPINRIRLLGIARKYLSLTLKLQGEKPEILLLLLAMESNSPIEYRDGRKVLNSYIEKLSEFEGYDSNVKYYKKKFSS